MVQAQGHFARSGRDDSIVRGVAATGGRDAWSLRPFVEFSNNGGSDVQGLGDYRPTLGADSQVFRLPRRTPGAAERSGRFVRSKGPRKIAVERGADYCVSSWRVLAGRENEKVLLRRHFRDLTALI
ncbi:hypothetical protein P7B02_04475 [Caulobacter segnis]|uniref:hypothetical protein n=1 Tax=Caulobacter segnis TaxID=88688 RepID=UPI00240EC05E|nr:hypothetical protein [Caulobacter segnis]MDG2520790.1 hypothetical protein [Caulobacter segnis]